MVRSKAFDIAYDQYLNAEMFKYNDFEEYIFDKYYHSDKNMFTALREERNDRYANKQYPYIKFNQKIKALADEKEKKDLS